MVRRSSFAALMMAIVAVVASACGSTTPSPSVSSPRPVATQGSIPETSAAPPTSPGVAVAVDPSPAPSPAPWASYASARYRYTVQHPAAWLVTPGSAKLADQIDDGSAHYVYLSRDARPGKISISATVTHDVTSFKRTYKAKLLTSKAITVNGWPGRLLTFTGVDAGRSVYIQHLVLGKGKVGYFVDMFSDRGSAPGDRALFKRIYKSFKPKS